MGWGTVIGGLEAAPHIVIYAWVISVSGGGVIVVEQNGAGEVADKGCPAATFSVTAVTSAGFLPSSSLPSHAILSWRSATWGGCVGFEA